MCLKPLLSFVLLFSKCGVLVKYDIPNTLPGFCCITAWHIWEEVLQEFDESCYQLRIISLVGIYMRFPFFLGVMNSFQLEFYLAADQGIVCVTICTLVAVRWTLFRLVCLVMIWSSWWQCLDLGYLQEPLCYGLVLK